MRILIADDDPISLRLLENSLKRLNHELVTAHDGTEAWKILTTAPIPEIAILDWMMPGLTGLEICQKLQTVKDRSFSYIIVLTSKDQPEDITIGLDAGANDYIIKPFDRDELKSRIAVGIRIMQYEKSLKIANETLWRYSEQVEELAQERAQQLVQAERMIFLGTMAAGISHEINNPLTIIHGNVSLLKNFWSNQGAALYSEALQNQPNLAKNHPQAQMVSDMFSAVYNALDRLRKIVDGMRAFSHGHGGKVETFNPMDCIKDSIQICLPKLKHLCEVKIVSEPIPFPVKGNAVQISQVLVNLFANAADALAGTPHPEIIATVKAIGSQLHIAVQDNGPGIPPDSLAKIWSPMFTTKPVGKGTGLGLPISAKLADEHGGELKVESVVNSGTTFTLILPNADDFDRFYIERQKENPLD